MEGGRERGRDGGGREEVARREGEREDLGEMEEGEGRMEERGRKGATRGGGG